MTIADDMRAASHGELARTRAQLKSANDEIEQLRRDLTHRTHGMFVAEERAKDLARKLDRAEQNITADRTTIDCLVIAGRALNAAMWQALDQYEINKTGLVSDVRKHVADLKVDQVERQLVRLLGMERVDQFHAAIRAITSKPPEQQQ